MCVCNAQPKLQDPSYGWPDGMHLLTPGDPERSPTAMPPIGRHQIDAAGVALVSQWITEMHGCAP